MTKIVILGAGSIGCWIGGYVVKGGADVTFIGRDRYARQIASHGLTLSHFERAKIHLSKIDFQTKAEALKGAEIIGLCVKSQDSKSAGFDILKYAPRAKVVSFQNGIRNKETLSQILPQENIIPAIVPFNVTQTDPGVFHCGTAGSLLIQDEATIEPLLNALRSGGQPVEVKDDILGDQWAKMIVNLNNGLNTLSGGPLVKGLLQRDYRRALARCVGEALEIARLNDVSVGQFNGRSPLALLKTLRLPNFAYRLIMQSIVKIDAKARSSMLDDLEAGKPSEIEYLQGEIVKKAQHVGVAAPNNAAILKAVNQAFSALQSPKMTGSEILGLLQD